MDQITLTISREGDVVFEDVIAVIRCSELPNLIPGGEGTLHALTGRIEPGVYDAVATDGRKGTILVIRCVVGSHVRATHSTFEFCGPFE